MSRAMNLVGNVYGDLTVLEFSHRTENNGMAFYKCSCTCGNTDYVVAHGRLRSGSQTRCNSKVHKRKPYNFKHGMKETKVYKSWCKIKERCLNKNDASYPAYGGAGISLANEFLDFLNFYEEVGDPPENSYKWSIDRLDNSKGYEKGNIAWADTFKQAQNKFKSCKNTSGATGVHSFHSGNENHSHYIVATWSEGDVENSRPRNKKFNCSELGIMEAWYAANLYRKNTLLWLNTQGASYSSQHGKDRKETL